MFVQLKQKYFGKEIGERIDVPEEKHVKSLIEQGIAEAIQGDPLGSLIETQVGNMLTNLTKSLDQTIAETLKKFGEAQSKSRKNGIPLIFGEGGEGDTKKNFGDWLLHVAKATVQKDPAARKHLEDVYSSGFSPWQKAAMSELGGSTGGYIVPPDFYQSLLAISAENNFFRQYAWVQPMASATLQFPYLDITTVQAAGVSPFFGGVKASWTEEAQQRSETEPAFKMMELKAHELSGYSVSSNVLLADAAFGLEKFLMMLFGKACGWYEQYAFLQGTGVGTPVGVLNAPAAVKVPRNTPGHFFFPDMAQMLTKLLPSSYAKAVWAVSPSVVADLMQMKDGSQRVVFLSIDQGATRPPVWKLLNLPIFITEMLPALGTTGDVMLIDPSLYVIGDRMSLEIAASEHVNFLKNQMTWRFVQRVDGQPWMEKPVTLQDGVSQVTPFVVLQ